MADPSSPTDTAGNEQSHSQLSDSLSNSGVKGRDRDHITAEIDKTALIGKACDTRNLRTLRKLAIEPHGLLKDELRRRAWPILLGCAQHLPSPPPHWQSLPAHNDEHQVKLDVDRAFVYYPAESDSQLSNRKVSLQDLITATLRLHPFLCYFQGYHDIVQVFLLAFGPPNSFPECLACVERLSLLRIRDFMMPTLEGAMAHMKLLPSILEAADKDLYMHVRQTHVTYGLSGMLTLYAHDIQEYGDIARLFDFLLATDAVMSIYLFAAIILSRRETLLEIPSTDSDVLLFTLSKLPQSLDLEPLISQSLELHTSHPPLSLPHQAWSFISQNSVLKTCVWSPKTHSSSIFHQSKLLKPRYDVPLEAQVVEDGMRYFHAQAAELAWAEKINAKKRQLRNLTFKYQRPARRVAITVFCVAVAYWLRPGTKANALVGGLLLGIRRLWLGW